MSLLKVSGLRLSKGNNQLCLEVRTVSESRVKQSHNLGFTDEPIVMVLCCEFTYVLSLVELVIFVEYLLDLHNISKYPLGAYGAFSQRHSSD